MRDFIESHGGVAAQIGYEGYKYATCVVSTTKSATDFLVKVLKDGDLIKVDMCVDFKGAISDSCWSYVVGESTPEIDRLMEVTKSAISWD